MPRRTQEETGLHNEKVARICVTCCRPRTQQGALNVRSDDLKRYKDKTLACAPGPGGTRGTYISSCGESGLPRPGSIKRADVGKVATSLDGLSCPLLPLSREKEEKVVASRDHVQENCGSSRF